MNKQLPAKPNLEYDKKQAKQLLKSFQSADDEAITRIHQHLPHIQFQPRKAAAAFPLTLMQAQTVIAREYGYKSWGDLCLAIKLKNKDYSDKVALFKQAIYQHDAMVLDDILTQHPDLRDTINDPHFAFGSTAVIISKHHMDIVDVLLKHGADINAKSQWWAGDFHVLEIVPPDLADKLIQRGADITPHAAAEQGWLDWLEEAYQADQDIIHLRGGDGKTPLHYATDPIVIDWLLERGANIEACDFDHQGTPLQWMVGQRKWYAVRLFIERGAIVDIFAAVALGNLDLVKKSLANHPEAISARVDEDGYSLVPKADGLHQYSYVFTSGVSPHQVALQFEHDDIFQYLIEQSPLDIQLLAHCANGDATQAHALLKAHPDLIDTIAPRDQQQLIYAAWNRDTHAVQLMLKLGFDPHLQDAEKMTALHRAAFHGFDDIVAILLEADDDPPLEWRNAYDGTPLTTCLYGHKHSWRDDGDFVKTVELLVEAGSQVKAEWLPIDESLDPILRQGIRESE